MTPPARSQYAFVLVLAPLNGTFERKSLVLPFAPEVLKLGRMTNFKTTPGPDNGYFDSRVLSRQHAEVWADRATGKVYIKDAKSSNGTYINSHRLSSDNTESAPHELKKNDILELGIDISNEDGSSLVHRKISARVERISLMSLAANGPVNGTNGGASMTPSSVGPLGPSGPGGLRKRGAQNRSDALDIALFGDVDASLEDLILGHARNSLGGMFMASGATSVAFENAVKQLVSQIHSARVEGAKINSIVTLLQGIQKKQSSKIDPAHILAQKLADKDARIVELEQIVQEQKEQLERHGSKESSSPASKRDSINSLPSPTSSSSSSQAEAVLRDLTNGSVENKDYSNINDSVDSSTQLAEVKCQLELFKSRALAAEELALNSSKTIAELVRTLEEKGTQVEPKIKDQVQELRDKQDANSNDAPTTSTTTTTTHTHAKNNISTRAAKAITITSALGVVLLGIGAMTLINSVSRDR